jgi:SAM-dependent methyltransferase
MLGGKTMNLKAELENYGITNTRLFGDSAKPELLDYLDLVEPRESSGLLPDGVAESQGRPLLFFVNESRLTQTTAEQDKNYAELRRKLACRGDRAYLARIRPGELKVVPVSLDDRMPEWQIYNRDTPEALTFFTRLAHGHYLEGEKPKDADYVFSAMFKLVWSVADRLAKLDLNPADVLSLMGRALFFRFLIDRKIVRENNRPAIAPKASCLEDCFGNAKNSDSTSAWLDEKFNGDLLPLTDSFQEIGRRTDGVAFIHLTAIVKGEEPSGDSGWQIPLRVPKAERNWDAYDFAHIPVGLLSQVYERFAWEWERENAEETSVHYTPRNIAATLVDEAFVKLPNAHEARVLDPACGAGVFLVLAFRRLYQARWEKTKKRPDTKAIREILEKQLVGFDISDSALKLAALSLYLTAIELDPKPTPPVRFTHLREKVLFYFRDEGIETGAVAGSLGERVGRRFDGKFNLVLSNPPWTSLKAKERRLADELNKLSRDIIERRVDKKTADAYENPDLGPDLPFVWKATEWCKPDGRIAMALPARILLKQEDIPRRARETFLRLVEVTGIINGTNLSDTSVWPHMSQPFMLLFALNRKPKPGHALRLITPHYDTTLNRNGDMRIDSNSAQSIEIETTFEYPWIWKTLSIGTSLDAAVVSKQLSSGFTSLLNYWRELELSSCQGYIAAAEKQEPFDASFLQGLPDLTKASEGEFILDTQFLPKFSRKTLNRPRTRKIYSAPLVLVKVSPGGRAETCRAILSLEDVAFDDSFYGYSAATHSESALLARYLQLFAHSKLWIYTALVTSSEYGAERRKLQKNDLDNCPIFPFERLTTTQRHTVARLSGRLTARDLTVFDEIDSFFGNLFGLDSKDIEVVRDTVEVAMPYIESRKRACNPPLPRDREQFRKRLESILHPFFRVTGDEPQVEFLKQPPLTPFGLLLITKRGTKISNPDELYREALLKLANDTGSTRIIQEVKGGLVVALLNQYRYWTPSRARLLGAELVREHLDVFDT